MEIFCNCSLNSLLTGISIHKACGVASDSCPQERSLGSYCRNKVKTQLTFKMPNATGTFSSHILRKNKDDKQSPKGHRTPNYYMRNTNQNNKKKSYHTGQNGHTKKSTDKCSSGLARDVTTPAPCLTLSVVDTGNSHWKDSLPKQGKNFQRSQA